MQSQLSQDSSFSGPLSLSLSKFSYSTVPEDSNAPIPWIHLSGKGNLFAIFEKCRSWDHHGQLHDQSKFRISNGAEIMEDLHLIALAAEARKAIDQNPASNILNRPSAVTIIVKKPCIAVRYPSGQGQIRRFQIRFLHDTDYYAAMGRFSEADAPVTEAGTFPVSQQQTRPFSSSSILYPSDSTSCLNTQLPSTPPVVSSEKRSRTSTSHILTEAENIQRVATSGSSTIQVSNPTYLRPQTISGGVYDQNTRRDIYTLPHEPPEAPEPGPVHLKHGTTTSQYWNDGHRLLQTPNQTYGDHLASHRPMSYTALSTPVTSLSHPSINLCEPGPSTAPMIESQKLSEMLPPKRDLPFSKTIPRIRQKASKKMKPETEIGLPTAAPKDHGRILESSSCHSSSQELQMQPIPPPTKPKQAPAKKAPTRVTKKPAVPRLRKKAASVREITPVPSVVEILRRAQESAKEVTTVSKTIDTQALLARVEEQQAVATHRNLDSEHYSAPSSLQEVKVMAQQGSSEASLTRSHPAGRNQATEASLFDEPAPQAKIFTSVTEVHGSQRRHHSPPQAQSILAQGIPPDIPVVTPDLQPVHQTLSEHPQNTVPTPSKPAVPSLAKLLTGPLASLWRDPHFAGSPSLAHWAKDSEEERLTSLETFICRSIQDEDFYKLCKDLGGTWQRLFLGNVVN